MNWREVIFVGETHFKTLQQQQKKAGKSLQNQYTAPSWQFEDNEHIALLLYVPPHWKFSIRRASTSSQMDPYDAAQLLRFHTSTLKSSDLKHFQP